MRHWPRSPTHMMLRIMRSRAHISTSTVSRRYPRTVTPGSAKPSTIAVTKSNWTISGRTASRRSPMRALPRSRTPTIGSAMRPNARFSASTAGLLSARTTFQSLLPVMTHAAIRWKPHISMRRVTQHCSRTAMQRWCAASTRVATGSKSPILVSTAGRYSATRALRDSNRIQRSRQHHRGEDIWRGRPADS